MDVAENYYTMPGGATWNPGYMAAPTGWDAATIGAVQNLLGLPATGEWNPETGLAFTQFQDAKGWGRGFGISGNPQEWEILTQALRNKDRSANNPATQDAAYMAFLRQMGAQEADIQRQIQERTESVQRAINRAAAGYSQQRQETVKNVGQSFEERGLYSSGIRQKEQDVAGAKVDYDRQQFEAGQTEALREANTNAQQQLSDLARRRTEEELAARQRIGQRRAEQVYNPLSSA